MKRVLTGTFGLLAILAAGWFAARRQAAPVPPEPATPTSPFARRIVRHPWLALGVVLLGLGIGGLTLLVSGIVPIKASAGHWAITRFFLQFAKHRSVATHSLGIETAPLEDPLLVLKGAGHYESGCAPCHGRPGEALPLIPLAMTPAPPRLGPRVSAWDPEELFSIVKHGLKFTGMPAWPAQQRDDEVWATVAFLQGLPDLSEDEYRRLVSSGVNAATGLSASLESPELPPRTIVAVCARCHGADGRGRGVGAFPKLAGQRYDYLAGSLRAFARGERYSGIMQPIAVALSEQTIHEAAEYYARLPPAWTSDTTAASVAASSAGSLVAAARGEVIATEGVPKRDIPACGDCHRTRGEVNSAYPILSGQYADYLTLQLHLLQEARRGGTPYVRLMRSFVHRLTADEIGDVALYFQSQGLGSDLVRARR